MLKQLVLHLIVAAVLLEKMEVQVIVWEMIFLNSKTVIKIKKSSREKFQMEMIIMKIKMMKKMRKIII
jgi:hypothetical protein